MVLWLASEHLVPAGSDVLRIALGVTGVLLVLGGFLVQGVARLVWMIERPDRRDDR